MTMKKSKDNVNIVKNLYYKDKQTAEEIAEITGLKISTVKQYIRTDNRFSIDTNNEYKTVKKKEPLMYAQIKAKSDKFHEEHGVRWGEGYIKLEPKPIEKVDLSKYETIPLRGMKKKAKRK